MMEDFWWVTTDDGRLERQTEQESLRERSSQDDLCHKGLIPSSKQ